MAYTFLCQFLPVLLPWSLDTACLMAIFMYMGLLLRNERWQQDFPLIYDLMLFVVYALLCTLNGELNVSVRESSLPSVAIPRHLLYTDVPVAYLPPVLSCSVTFPDGRITVLWCQHGKGIIGRCYRNSHIESLKQVLPLVTSVMTQIVLSIVG